MNQEFDSEESINSDEAIKAIEFKYLTPNFHHELDDKGTSVNKRMNGINTMMCKFKDVLGCKDDICIQSNGFKSTNQVSTQNMQTQSGQKINQSLDIIQQTQIHLANSRRRHNSRNSIDKQPKNRQHQNSQALQTNLISNRKPKRQIYVTQIVNDHNDLNSFPFPHPQRISRMLANNDCLHSQKGSSASTQKGILKSSSFEVIKIGSRQSMQSLNSPMMRPSSKRVSFEFNSEQMRKLRNHNTSIDPKKYQRLKTKFQK
ncbi:unnamed protein product [Paramecium pentaurelia]|uniref:Uncharacterized protein n=1 Tax=Paramecium pentaurelia TaxID=43138 RepID=A0A8S1YAN3_9CILI|nr:unnamed protein product [Paramecium pentaurelia]